MSLPNVWKSYGLRANPFYSQPLDSGPDHPLRPITLFVGRERETDAVLSSIGGGLCTATLVAGRYGVGKTTFIHHLRYMAGKDAAVADPGEIRITSTMTVESVAAEILRRVLTAAEGTLGRRLKRRPIYEKAREVVSRVDQWSASINLLGAGAGGGRTSTTPPHPVHDLAGLCHELATEALSMDADHRVLLHINNLENVFDPADPSPARRLFRDLRDLLQLDGVHVVLGAGEDFYREVIRPEEKVSDILGTPVVLEPLERKQVWRALELRTRHFALEKRIVSPVRRGTLDSLYAAYGGNLRGVFTLLGQAIEARPAGRVPLGWRDLAPAARQVAVARVAAAISETDLGYLRTIYDRFGSAELRQTDLGAHVQVKQPTLSRAMGRLLAAKVLDLVRDEPPSRFVRLSGTALIALGWDPGE